MKNLKRNLMIVAIIALFGMVPIKVNAGEYEYYCDVVSVEEYEYGTAELDAGVYSSLNSESGWIRAWAWSQCSDGFQAGTARSRIILRMGYKWNDPNSTPPGGIMRWQFDSGHETESFGYVWGNGDAFLLAEDGYSGSWDCESENWCHVYSDGSCSKTFSIANIGLEYCSNGSWDLEEEFEYDVYDAYFLAKRSGVYSGPTLMPYIEISEGADDVYTFLGAEAEGFSASIPLSGDPNFVLTSGGVSEVSWTAYFVEN